MLFRSLLFFKPVFNYNNKRHISIKTINSENTETTWDEYGLPNFAMTDKEFVYFIVWFVYNWWIIYPFRSKINISWNLL